MRAGVWISPEETKNVPDDGKGEGHRNLARKEAGPVNQDRSFSKKGNFFPVGCFAEPAGRLIGRIKGRTLERICFGVIRQRGPLLLEGKDFIRIPKSHDPRLVVLTTTKLDLLPNTQTHTCCSFQFPRPVIRLVGRLIHRHMDLHLKRPSRGLLRAAAEIGDRVGNFVCCCLVLSLVICVDRPNESDGQTGPNKRSLKSIITRGGKWRGGRIDWLIDRKLSNTLGLLRLIQVDFWPAVVVLIRNFNRKF